MAKTIDMIGDLKVYYGDKINFEGAAFLGEDVFIDARGGLDIGRNVILGPKVAIITYNHDYKNKDWAPYSPDIVEKKIRIDRNVWVGYGAIILPGAEIGPNSVVAAGSVVRGKFPEGSLISGNPAQKIGSISKNENPIEYQTKMSALRRWG